MDSLSSPTPERVSLSLPLAGIGSRTGAYLIDAGALFAFWLVVYFLLSLGMEVVESFRALSGVAQSVIVVGVFASQWVYWTLSETLWNGQSLGKRLVGIRVVREDGAPAGFLESAVRNLVRVVDFLPALYGLGVIVMLSTREHRRLGDLAAGTRLIRLARVSLDRYAGPSVFAIDGAQPAAATEALSPEETELILSFLDRAASLEPPARTRLASGLVARFGASLPADERARVGASLEASESYLRQRVQRPA